MEQPVTIKEAAKAVGMGREQLRAVVKSAGIGRVWGGPEKHPHLRVLVSEVRDVLMSRRYVPADKASGKARPARRGEAVNADLKC